MGDLPRDLPAWCLQGSLCRSPDAHDVKQEQLAQMPAVGEPCGEELAVDPPLLVGRGLVSQGRLELRQAALHGRTQEALHKHLLQLKEIWTKHQHVISWDHIVSVDETSMSMFPAPGRGWFFTGAQQKATHVTEGSAITVTLACKACGWPFFISGSSLARHSRCFFMALWCSTRASSTPRATGRRKSGYSCFSKRYQ